MYLDNPHFTPTAKIISFREQRSELTSILTAFCKIPTSIDSIVSTYVDEYYKKESPSKKLMSIVVDNENSYAGNRDEFDHDLFLMDRMVDSLGRHIKPLLPVIDNRKILYGGVSSNQSNIILHLNNRIE